MELMLFEEDFVGLVDDPKVNERLEQRSVVLGEEEDRARKAILEAVPSAISRKIEKLLPKGFHVNKFEVKISLKGSPLGVGVDGDVVVTFIRKSATC